MFDDTLRIYGMLHGTSLYYVVGHIHVSHALGHVTFKWNEVSIGPLWSNIKATNQCTNKITPPGYGTFK